MLKTIQIGPQTYTFRAELEAEVRRLLWSQLGLERHGTRGSPQNDVQARQADEPVEVRRGGGQRRRGALRLVHG